MARKARNHAMLRIKGPGVDRLEDLLRDSYVVGRGDPSGETHVDFEVRKDEHLSRAHCTISKTDKGYVVDNLSPNGTLLNGRKVSAPKRLTSKDRVEVGADTTLDFFLYTDDERARALAIKTGGEEEEEGTTVVAQPKSFFQRPIFLLMLGFYGIIAILVASALGKEKKQAKDPGPGPYFQWMLESEVPTQKVEQGGQEVADRMWARAQLRHGGPLVGEGDHAYRLVLEARKVVGILGYETLYSALEQGHPVAQLAKIALDDLEERIARLYAEGKGYVKARHWTLARQRYEAILDAVPDREAVVRTYALQRANRLKGRR